MKTLKDLFLDSLSDLNYAENQLVKTLPIMATAATHGELRETFTAHRLKTESHVRKVERIFEFFGKQPENKKCPAITGLLEEANQIAAENKKSPTINAALIFAAQKVKHYEIASYGSLRAWARQLQNEDAACLFDEILYEAKSADKTLKALAETQSNLMAQVGMDVEPERPLACAA